MELPSVSKVVQPLLAVARVIVNYTTEYRFIVTKKGACISQAGGGIRNTKNYFLTLVRRIAAARIL